jgi:hypothetical protein
VESGGCSFWAHELGTGSIYDESGEGFFPGTSSRILGVTKSSVQVMLKRAEKKMLKQKETSLFLVG